MAAAVFTWQSGFPIGVIQSNSNSNLQGNGQRPNLVSGVDVGTAGDWPDRAGVGRSPDCGMGQRGRVHRGAGRHLGHAPRVDRRRADAESTETDISVAKNVALGGCKQVQIKVEVINLFNRVQLRGNQMITTQGNTAFGKIVSQGGFMRMTQVLFRYSWSERTGIKAMDAWSWPGTASNFQPR